LSGHGVEVEAGLEASNLGQRQRQEVEEQRAVGLGGEGNHLALRLGIGLGVDVLEIRRLAAETRPVIDDLAADFARRVVDEGHRGFGSRYSVKRLSMSSSVISANGEPAPGASTFLRSPSKIRPSSSLAFFTRRRTSPRLERLSKITTRI